MQLNPILNETRPISDAAYFEELDEDTEVARPQRQGVPALVWEDLEVHKPNTKYISSISLNTRDL